MTAFFVTLFGKRLGAGEKKAHFKNLGNELCWKSSFRCVKGKGGYEASNFLGIFLLFLFLCSHISIEIEETATSKKKEEANLAIRLIKF